MKITEPAIPAARTRVLRDPVFVALLVGVSLAFVWILLPFFGAAFWAVVLAIVFRPLYRWFARVLRDRCSLASALTVLVVLLIVILPAALIAAMLVQEASGLYARVQSGEFSLGRALQALVNALPAPAIGWLDRVGLPNLGQFQEQFTAGILKGAQFVGARALNLGQHTLGFVVGLFITLYVMFFLLRDGGTVVRRLVASVPLADDLMRELASRFTRVIRATVKGNIVVAVVQGFLGGLVFWLFDLHAPVLWGVVMAFLALLPAVGTALVWGPVAIGMLLSGSTWQGIVLLAYGALVIGLVDNVLRPVLVGKDTRMPDYIVLLSTLGGIALFGLNGFVIGPVVAAMFLAVWDIVAVSKARGELKA